MNDEIIWIYRGTNSTPSLKHRTEIEHIALGAIRVHERNKIEPEEDTRHVEYLFEGPFDPNKEDFEARTKIKKIKELVLDLTDPQYLAQIKVYYCWNYFRELSSSDKAEIDLNPNYEVHIIELESYDDEYEEDGAWAFEEDD